LNNNKIRNLRISVFLELYKETPLINREEEIEDEKDPEITFNFITEIFFMSHLSYSYSVHRLHRILIKVIFRKKYSFKNEIHHLD
jgi:hypothetical protein